MDAEELKEGEEVSEDIEEELKEGEEVGEDDQDELKEGEVDSDTNPGGEVTEGEEEDDGRGYMGCGLPSDSEESVYPISSAESVKSRVSFATSLTYSLEEEATVGGNGMSLRHPDTEEEVDTGKAGVRLEVTKLQMAARRRRSSGRAMLKTWKWPWSRSSPRRLILKS